jgi:hypothetical protein
VMSSVLTVALDSDPGGDSMRLSQPMSHLGISRAGESSLQNSWFGVS